MKTKIMGVLNCTPDSFYAQSRAQATADVLNHVAHMIAEGVHIVDIGAESTAPYATPITAEEEKARLLPVLKLVRNNFNIPISVDTRHASTMQAALDFGVEIINDVSALSDPNALAVLKKSSAKIVLMHMKGAFTTMQDGPTYTNVVDTVHAFLVHKVKVCVEAGIDLDRLIIDPGFGFGKTPTQNIELMQKLGTFKKIGCPILVGFSRKATIGYLTNRVPQERLAGSLAAHQIAVQNGADIIRTHDVGPTHDMLKIYHAFGEKGV